MLTESDLIRPTQKVIFREQNHVSNNFVFIPLSQTSEIITVFIIHCLWPFQTPQSLCKCSHCLKIIITVPVGIMHTYDVRCIQCPCSITRCCVQEYTALYNNQSESTELAQITLCTEREPRLSPPGTDFVNVTATQTGFSRRTTTWWSSPSLNHFYNK